MPVILEFLWSRCEIDCSTTRQCNDNSSIAAVWRDFLVSFVSVEAKSQTVQAAFDSPVQVELLF